MGIGAIVGLLRFFLTHEFHNAHNNGGLKRMVEKHGLATGLVKGNEYLDSLGTELISRNILFFYSRRIGENATCKAASYYSEGKEERIEYYFSGQNLFDVSRSSTHIIPIHGSGTTDPVNVQFT